MKLPVLTILLVVSLGVAFLYIAHHQCTGCPTVDAVRRLLESDLPKSHYEVLGVSANAQDNDIEGAYIRMKSDGLSDTTQIELAYSVLTSRDLRATYDTTLPELLRSVQSQREVREQSVRVVGLCLAACLALLGLFEAIHLQNKADQRAVEQERVAKDAVAAATLEEELNSLRKEADARKQQIEKEIADAEEDQRLRKRNVSEQRDVLSEYINTVPQEERQRKLAVAQEVVAARLKVQEQQAAEERERRAREKAQAKAAAKELEELKARGVRLAREHQQATMAAVESTEGLSRRAQEEAERRERHRRKEAQRAASIPDVVNATANGQRLGGDTDRYTFQ